MSIPTVVGFHYTLKDPTGAEIDSSKGGNPFYVMLGRSHIVKGLDEALQRMDAGEKKHISISPEDGYGAMNEDLRLKVHKDQFPAGAELNIGDQFQTEPEPGAPIFTVKHIEDDYIYIDGNHPLAGVELHFDVELLEKRPANPEEIAHGHAHGPHTPDH